MGPVSSVAQSGLKVESMRLAVSANNVANTLTNGFTPSTVVASEAAGGGVTGEVFKPRDLAADARTDGLAMAAASKTDLVSEVVTQSMSSAAFRANLASLKTDQENFDALISIRR